MNREERNEPLPKFDRMWLEDDLRGQMKTPQEHKRSKANIKIWGLVDLLDHEGSILDVGCHSGWMSHWLRQNNWKGKYFGIDIWREAIDFAEEKFPEETFLHMDIFDLAKVETSFDLVWCGQLKF